MERPTILVCNDDGYFAEGIGFLREALAPLGRVICVAPDRDCSGVSHKITLDRALRIRNLGPDTHAVNGSPVDCIHLAFHELLQGKPPDLVVSGINHGPNLGEDTAYSGTVAAAYEGFVHKSPALAISTGKNQRGHFEFEKAAKVAYGLAQKLLDRQEDSLRDAVWNVNVPPGPFKGFRIVRLDSRSFKSSVVARVDPRGKPYYWLGPYSPKFDNRENTDYAAYRSGYVTMTPLKVEMTHFEVLEKTSGVAESFASLLK